MSFMPAFVNQVSTHRQNQTRAVRFAGASERRGRASSLQLAAPPVATRNGLARPPRIGAPGTSILSNKIKPENSGRTQNYMRLHFGVMSIRSHIPSDL